MNNCKDCEFFVRYDAPPDNPFGKCHRRAPLVTGGLHCEVSTQWPEVKNDQGCGDWERKVKSWHSSGPDGGPPVPSEPPKHAMIA